MNSDVWTKNWPNLFYELCRFSGLSISPQLSSFLWFQWPCIFLNWKFKMKWKWQFSCAGPHSVLFQLFTGTLRWGDEKMRWLMWVQYSIWSLKIDLTQQFRKSTLQIFIPRVIGMYALCIIAFVIYAMRIPERWITGKVDYGGHSHNWWHIFILGALYYWHNSGKQSYWLFYDFPDFSFFEFEWLLACFTSHYFHMTKYSSFMNLTHKKFNKRWLTNVTANHFIVA